MRICRKRRTTEARCLLTESNYGEFCAGNFGGEFDDITGTMSCPCNEKGCECRWKLVWQKEMSKPPMLAIKGEHPCTSGLDPFVATAIVALKNIKGDGTVLLVPCRKCNRLERVELCGETAAGVYVEGQVADPTGWSVLPRVLIAAAALMERKGGALEIQTKTESTEDCNACQRRSEIQMVVDTLAEVRQQDSIAVEEHLCALCNEESTIVGKRVLCAQHFAELDPAKLKAHICDAKDVKKTRGETFRSKVVSDAYAAEEDLRRKRHRAAERKRVLQEEAAERKLEQKTEEKYQERVARVDAAEEEAIRVQAAKEKRLTPEGLDLLETLEGLMVKYPGFLRFTRTPRATGWRNSRWYSGSSSFSANTGSPTRRCTRAQSRSMRLRSAKSEHWRS